jgi:hypothetical protein
VLIDALDKITGGTENYSSAIPEPFTFIPENQRSIALEDGSITSSFLELFGRSVPRHRAGVRTQQPPQRRPAVVHLLNSSQTQRKIEQSPMIKNLVVAGKEPARHRHRHVPGHPFPLPDEDELKIAEGYFQSGKVAGERRRWTSSGR